MFIFTVSMLSTHKKIHNPGKRTHKKQLPGYESTMPFVTVYFDIEYCPETRETFHQTEQHSEEENWNE